MPWDTPGRGDGSGWRSRTVLGFPRGRAGPPLEWRSLTSKSWFPQSIALGGPYRPTQTWDTWGNFCRASGSGFRGAPGGTRVQTGRAGVWVCA